MTVPLQGPAASLRVAGGSGVLRESRTFLGHEHGGVPVSFFIQASAPGHGPAPHRHPYAEVFVLHEGSGSFLAGNDVIEASGGSVVVVPPGEVHGFTASPGAPLRMTCLHLNDRMLTEWVERTDG